MFVLEIKSGEPLVSVLPGREGRGGRGARPWGAHASLTLRKPPAGLEMKNWRANAGRGEKGGEAQSFEIAPKGLARLTLLHLLVKFCGRESFLARSAGCSVAVGMGMLKAGLFVL